MTCVCPMITITFNNDESAKYDKELCYILFTTIKNFIDDIQNDEITIPYDKKTFDILFGGLLATININQTNELTAFLGIIQYTQNYIISNKLYKEYILYHFYTMDGKLSYKYS